MHRTLQFAGLLVAAALAFAGCARKPTATASPEAIFAAHRADFARLVQAIGRCEGETAFYARYRQSTRCASGDPEQAKAISRELQRLGVLWAIAARSPEPGAALEVVSFVVSSEGLMIGPGRASMIDYYGDGVGPLPENRPLDDSGHWFSRDVRD